MKKFLALVLCAALFAVLAIPVTAATVPINAPKGTPVIDGEKDDIYGDFVAIDSMHEGTPGATGRVASAWDDANIYFYAEIFDTTPNHNHNNDWEGDSLEIFIDWNSAKGDDTYNDGNPYWQIRIHSSPNEDTGGTQISGGGNFADMGGDYQAIPYSVKPLEGNNFNSGYIVEVAMPIALNSGINSLAENGTVMVSFQINDNQEDMGRSSMAYIIIGDDTSQEWQWPHACYGLLTLGAAPAPAVVEVEDLGAGGGDPAEIPVPVVEAPAPAAPAPVTADPITLIVLGSLISAAGVVIARKRK